MADRTVDGVTTMADSSNPAWKYASTGANLDALKRVKGMLRTTVTLDEKLLERAAELAGPMDRSTLLNTALKSLIARETARRLALLGGSEPDLKAVPRRRSEPSAEAAVAATASIRRSRSGLKAATDAIRKKPATHR